jgi:hypothetical protein
MLETARGGSRGPWGGWAAILTALKSGDFLDPKLLAMSDKRQITDISRYNVIF